MLTLDAIDQRILAELQHNAAQSNQALAARVHVSPATALRRVSRLTKSGIIEKQVAILDPQKLGASLTAILEVTLERQQAEELLAFESRAGADEAVLQCYRVSAGPDFILIVQTRDMQAYHALVERLLNTANQVRNVRAFFSTRRAKFVTAIALNVIAAEGALP